MYCNSCHFKRDVIALESVQNLITQKHGMERAIGSRTISLHWIHVAIATLESMQVDSEDVLPSVQAHQQLFFTKISSYYLLYIYYYGPCNMILHNMVQVYLPLSRTESSGLKSLFLLPYPKFVEHASKLYSTVLDTVYNYIVVPSTCILHK